MLRLPLFNKPRSYRSELRNNAVSWKGVKIDYVTRPPMLVKVTSQRGEDHYETIQGLERRARRSSVG